MSGYYMMSMAAYFRQSNGFYVSDDGELCYWPRKNSPGWVIPRPSYDEIGGLHYRRNRFAVSGTWFILAGLLVLAVSTKAASIEPAYAAILFLPGLGFMAGALMQRRRLMRRLNDFAKIDQPRPKAVDRIVQARQHKVPFLLVVYSICLYCFVTSARALVQGDDWIDWAFGLVGMAVCGWPMIHIYVYRRKPLSVDEHIPAGGLWMVHKGVIKPASDKQNLDRTVRDCVVEKSPTLTERIRRFGFIKFVLILLVCSSIPAVIMMAYNVHIILQARKIVISQPEFDGKCSADRFGLSVEAINNNDRIVTWIRYEVWAFDPEDNGNVKRVISAPPYHQEKGISIKSGESISFCVHPGLPLPGGYDPHALKWKWGISWVKTEGWF